ncbi:hypothetical protein BCR37DRAFT_212073 [Protomyces lactucae-debilis]|uniref:Uncharacterized protein n=1 Tax=Protomyces lactucae-debilis TaxID=2754530 RepID=A0A1Y2FQJ1_PROLT|nr:uncharacterized protein BCR37DRAFT_212073 [Protomyces lactucae-debilis]ORY86272.1 hypothetical protein BCR37DRAFT_212073 [Protomyces lactucae-debilis]
MTSSLQTASKDPAKAVDTSMLDEYELVQTAHGVATTYASSSCDETHEDDLSSLTEHTTDDEEDRHSNNDSTTSQKTSGYHPQRTTDASSSDEHPAGESGDDWEDEMESRQAESNVTLQMPAVHGSRELPRQEEPLRPVQEQVNFFDHPVKGPMAAIVSWLAFFAFLYAVGVFDGERDKSTATEYAKLPLTFGNMSKTLTSLEFHQLSGINTLIVLPLYLRVQHNQKMPSIMAIIKREGSNEFIQSKLSLVLDNLYSLDWSPAETWGTLVVQARYKLPGTYAGWQEDAYSIHYERLAPPALRPTDFEDMLYKRYRHMDELKGQVLVKLDRLLKTLDSRWPARLYDDDVSMKRDAKQPDKESKTKMMGFLNKLMKQETAVHDPQAQAKPHSAISSSSTPKNQVDATDQSAVALNVAKAAAGTESPTAPKAILEAVEHLLKGLEKAKLATRRETQDKAKQSAKQALHAISNVARTSIVKTKQGVDGLMGTMAIVKEKSKHGLERYNKLVKGEKATMARERLKRGTKRAQSAAKIASAKVTQAGKDGYVSLKHRVLAQWHERRNQKMKQVMAAEMPNND